MTDQPRQTGIKEDLGVWVGVVGLITGFFVACVVSICKNGWKETLKELKGD